uniref:Uncharacterized protein n=1 Tax=Arundo donax TaxID=35708 RepID=A0A0A9EAB0_ARUDO
MGGPTISIRRVCLGSSFILWLIIHLQNMLKYRIILLQLSSFKTTLWRGTGGAKSLAAGTRRRGAGEVAWRWEREERECE